MNTTEHKKDAFARLLKIMDELREQCPWDREQTFESLRHLTIEETYELADSILEKNYSELKKELGDLLLHIVFYARIASEKNLFDVADVIHSVCEKLIVRHPHIYGNVKVENAKEVKQNWEQIKLKEGNKSVLGGVPHSLPSLVKAQRMQEKAAQVGFDWNEKEKVLEKLNEEIIEFNEVKNTDKDKAEEEFGDILFALVNYARHSNINADDALERTNLKFRKRFMYIEDEAKKIGTNMNELTLDEMENLWQKAKTE